MMKGRSSPAEGALFLSVAGRGLAPDVLAPAGLAKSSL